jgi:hypothetical protein
MEVCRLLVGSPEVKRPLGRSTRRSVDNIKMDLLEKGWSDIDWIGLREDSEISTVGLLSHPDFLVDRV